MASDLEGLTKQDRAYALKVKVTAQKSIGMNPNFAEQIIRYCCRGRTDLVFVLLKGSAFSLVARKYLAPAWVVRIRAGCRCFESFAATCGVL